MGIEQYLQQILSARYGKDVRQSIHDSIYEINEVAKKAEYDASTAPESAKAYAQAALASEQAAEDYKTAAEQAAQQAMSGTPEGYADLVAKVNSIYRQTATSFNVVGTSEGSALAHTIYGMSVQDGTPTPSVPVEIQSAKANFKCVGKNLIPYPYVDGTSKTNYGITYTVNSDGSVNVSGTKNSDALSQYYFQTTLNLPKGTYKLSGCPSGGSASKYRIRLIVNYQLGNAHVYSDNGNGTTFTIDDVVVPSATRIMIDYLGNTGASYGDLVFHPMLTLADADQTYEPYKETEVTTDLTLRALEVPQNSGYNLVKDGKYYVADTVDWSEDKGYEITRRIGHQTGGVVSWYQSYNDSKQLNINLKSPAFSIDMITSKMNRFVLDTTQSKRAGTFWLASQRTSAVVFLPTSVDITSIQSGQTWIDNNPTEIVYRLATPTTEPITSAQAQALLSLKTYDEATSISATGDIEPSLDLEYSKDRNTALALTGHNLAHKNALKLNDINTALIELGGN